MTWLHIDQGNSRVKIAIESSDATLRLCDWTALASPTVVSAIKQVVLAGVGDESKRLAIVSRLQAMGISAPVLWVRYDENLLPSHYENPLQLGIDRWLVMLAVRDAGCAIVADVGTACTVDVLEQGRHVGGYIVPGLALQQKVLADYTAAVKVATLGWHPGHLGLTTQACVNQGSATMLKAFIEHEAKKLAERVQLPVALFVTGGDSHWLQVDNSIADPLLVFKGMQRYRMEMMVT